MTHEEKLAELVGAGKLGVELCRHGRQLPEFNPKPIAVAISTPPGAPACADDIIAAPTALPFPGNALDYVAAIHVLNHLPNPVAALAEWYRVLRPGGLMYLVTDHHTGTADHGRACTTVDHLLEDYVRGTGDGDASHIDEFVYDTDWAIEHPELSPEEYPAERAALARRLHEAAARGESLDIRYHTFTPETLGNLAETLCCWPRRRLNWEVAASVVPFPDDNAGTFLTVLRVHKGWLDRAKADAFSVVAKSDRRGAVMAEAGR
jgi:SAM-dependent methyltransferase